MRRYLLPPSLTAAQLPAFPGAEGAGKHTSGGRGTAARPTTVLEVTSLADDGAAGTLRCALAQPARVVGPRRPAASNQPLAFNNKAKECLAARSVSTPVVARHSNEAVATPRCARQDVLL